MSVLRRVLGAFAVFGMLTVGLGSEAVGQGATCSRNADCPSDLKCFPDGSCREWCRVDRDCGPGQQCVVAQSRVHVCQLIPIDKRALCATEKMTCVFARDCASGRCSNGLCQ